MKAMKLRNKEWVQKVGGIHKSNVFFALIISNTSSRKFNLEAMT